MATGGRRTGRRKVPEAAVPPIESHDPKLVIPDPVAAIPPALAAPAKTRRIARPRPVAEASTLAEVAMLQAEPATPESTASDPIEVQPIAAAAPVEPEPRSDATPEPIAKPAPEPVAASEPATIEQTPIIETPATQAVIPAKDSIMDVTNDTTQKAQAMFSDLTARSQGAVEKSQKMFGEIAEFNKGNVEAFVESSRIAARGFETMGQDAVAYAKSSFEGMTQALKTLSTVKSPTEFMKLQADYARSAFDAMVAQTSKSTETTLKLAGEVAQPISNRVAVASEKMKISA
ncbi:phasin family protein [Sphingomonas sp. S-NIH.Pt15_0812]|uniref:phasin family protein n=1 Tax=Sphingomonas sp. S-NIH.Pt15_0812 TaxID=1920129 RepID=UPI001F49AEBB|nr:phasin family protein [Sphingomonas sp. S-NIH.Pt15_0812]